MAKSKKSKKGKGGDAVETPSVIAHPRARVSIRRWRGRAGLLAAHFVAWIVGIVAWRHLVLAELIAHREAQEALLRERQEAAERRAAEALAAHAAKA